MSVSSLDWPASELLSPHASVHVAGGLVRLIGIVVAPWPDVGLPDLCS